jgi:hypothetical protein
MPVGYSTGAQTWVLGVVQAGSTGFLNLADGALPPLTTGTHQLKLYGTSVGYFVSGAYWMLVVEQLDGTFLTSAVVPYP